MIKIKTTGYYLSTPFHYEDWHAGVKIERLNYLAFHFSDKGIIYRKGKQNTTTFIQDDLLLYGAKGEYNITGNIIEYIFKKGQEFEIRRQLTILGIDLVVDQDQDEYRWTAFPTEKKTFN